MACISCGSGLHNECDDEPCCCKSNPPVAALELEDDDWRKPRRQGKRDATLKDQQSTGRKRAAVAYPLDYDAQCEWKGLKFAGGGTFPIVGCRNGLQQARHHGPDKNTLNNDKGNVHRICHTCHNRWHAKNDPVYVPGEIPNRHDNETKAMVDDILDSEVYFTRNKPKKVKAD